MLKKTTFYLQNITWSFYYPESLHISTTKPRKANQMVHLKWKKRKTKLAGRLLEAASPAVAVIHLVFTYSYCTASLINKHSKYK